MAEPLNRLGNSAHRSIDRLRSRYHTQQLRQLPLFRFFCFLSFLLSFFRWFVFFFLLSVVGGLFCARNALGRFVLCAFRWRRRLFLFFGFFHALFLEFRIGLLVACLLVSLTLTKKQKNKQNNKIHIGFIGSAIFIELQCAVSPVTDRSLLTAQLKTSPVPRKRRNDRIVDDSFLLTELVFTGAQLRINKKNNSFSISFFYRDAGPERVCVCVCFL